MLKKLNKPKYDLVIMSHVLEHIDKNKIIITLKSIYSILKNGGRLIIMVPNAQSNTGCYWAYEDFTHKTLFTAGSLLYVLRSAGFKEIVLLDRDCTAGNTFLKKQIKKIFLYIYRFNKLFWNKITGSSYHKPSPIVFSYEIKMIAKK